MADLASADRVGYAAPPIIVACGGWEQPSLSFRHLLSSGTYSESSSHEGDREG